jgi:hypothetical protein
MTFPIRGGGNMAITIMWDDLTDEKQAEVLEKCGNNCNFDVFPIAEITYGDDIEED